MDYKHSDDVACNTDDDGCTVNDSCFDGVCTPGAQANCSNQSDQCNLGVCESLSEQNYQCVKEPVGQGDNCDDENYCTINDACNDTGDCLGGGPRDCSALTSIENCTVGLCSEAQSKCYAATAPDGATCNDGEPCTLADTCVSGQCKGQMDGCEQRQLNGTYQGGDAPGSWFLPRATNIGNGNILVLWRTSAESLRARVVDRDMSLSTEIIDITNGASFPKDQDDGCYNGISRADIAVAPNGNWLIAYSYRYGLIESINNHPYYYSTVMMFRVMFSAFNANLDQQKAWSELWLGGAPGYQEHQTKPACSWLQEGGYSYPDDFITVLAFPDSSFGVLEKIYYDHQPVMWPIAANFSYDKYTFKKLPSNATKYKRPSAAVLGNGKVPIVWNTPNEIANKGLVGIGVYDFTAENWAIGTGAANMSADPGHQAYPVVAALPDNRYATAFSSLSFGGPGKLYLQYFNSNGTADGSALQPTTGNDTGVAAGPEVLDNDSMVMTWWRNGADGNEDGIEACIYSANLNKTVQPFVVNDETAGIQKFPVPVADGNEWVVVWATQYPAVGGWPAQPTYDYYLKRYNQAGKPVAGAPERRAAENLTGDQDNAEAAATDSGAVMVWESDSVDNDSTGISMRILDADGAPMTSETMVNVTTGNAQTQPSVTFSSAVNRIGVAWTSYGQVDSNDVMFRLFGSNGSPVTSELMANQTTGGDQAAPSVTAVSNGDFVVAWSGYSNDLDLTDIYARAFSSDGQALGNEFIINSTLSGDQTNPTVLRYGNSSSAFVAAWVKIGGSGSNGIYVRRFNKDGSPESAEALVAQVSSPDSYNVDRHNTTGIGAICWQKNGVWCRVLGTQLTPQGNAFSVGDNSPGNPSVVVRGTNEFWVTYDRVGVDSGGRAIVREIVDSSGNTLGFPILVNWHEAGNQMIPFSVLLDNNDLLVGWRSTSQDGSGEGVFYRFLD